MKKIIILIVLIIIVITIAFSSLSCQEKGGSSLAETEKVKQLMENYYKNHPESRPSSSESVPGENKAETKKSTENLNISSESESLQPPEGWPLPFNEKIVLDSSDLRDVDSYKVWQITGIYPGPAEEIYSWYKANLGGFIVDDDSVINQADNLKSHGYRISNDNYGALLVFTDIGENEADVNLYVEENEQSQEQSEEQPEVQQQPQGSEKQPEQSTTSQLPVSSDYTSKMLNIINAVRAEQGLLLLSLNSTLCTIASNRSNDMLTRNYFSHTTPEGKNLFIILKENGIGYSAAAENIQHSYPASNTSAEMYFDNWMNSSAHRENILNGNFSQIGIGFGSKDGWFVSTLVFLG